MSKKQLRQDLTALFKDLDEATRGEMLAHLNGHFCAQCGGETDEEGECCD